MTAGKNGKPREVVLKRPRGPAEFKALGGSDVDEFNQGLANEVLSALWVANSSEEERQRQYLAATAVLMGTKPRDELEGMLLAQMIGCHSAAMECFRRAMNSQQGFEVRQAQLGAAAKLSRTYAALLEALNRHRGKGQQLVRVEHVTVQAGGQAIVGAVNQGAGVTTKLRIDPMHPDPSPMHRSPRCGARTRSGSPCGSPAMKGRQRCRMHGGAIGSGARPGNRNALRHGRYSRELIEFRRAVRELLRESAEKLGMLI